YNMQGSPLRQTIGTSGFHQAVDYSTGPGSFYRVAEQPVLPSHSKGTDGVLGKVIGNLAPGVKQVVLHVGLLFTGVLHRLSQISSQRLLFQLFQPAPKSPEHGFLHRKALFLSFFGWQFCQFLFSCKQLVAVIPTNLCLCEKAFWIAGCSRHGFYELSAQMGPAAAAGNIRYLVVARIAVGMQVSVKPLQKLLWVFTAASGLVLVQNNGRQPIHTGTVNP